MYLACVYVFVYVCVGRRLPPVATRDSAGGDLHCERGGGLRTGPWGAVPAYPVPVLAIANTYADADADAELALSRHRHRVGAASRVGRPATGLQRGGRVGLSPGPKGSLADVGVPGDSALHHGRPSTSRTQHWRGERGGGCGSGRGAEGAQGNGGIADGEQEAHSRAATTRAFRDWLDAWTGNSTGPVLGPEVTTLCGSGREQGRERSRRVRRRLVDDNDWIVDDDDDDDDIRDFDDDEEDGEGREEVPNVLILRGPSGTPCH